MIIDASIESPGYRDYVVVLDGLDVSRCCWYADDEAKLLKIYVNMQDVVVPPELYQKITYMKWVHGDFFEAEVKADFQLVKKEPHEMLN